MQSTSKRRLSENTDEESSDLQTTKQQKLDNCGEKLAEWITASEKLLSDSEGDQAVCVRIQEELNSTYRQMFVTYVDGKPFYNLSWFFLKINLVKSKELKIDHFTSNHEISNEVISELRFPFTSAYQKYCVRFCKKNILTKKEKKKKTKKYTTLQVGP